MTFRSKEQRRGGRLHSRNIERELQPAAKKAVNVSTATESVSGPQGKKGGR